MATATPSVKLTDIQVDPDHNPRDEFAKQPIEQLTASLKTQGLLQPLLVTPAEAKGKYKLIDGERRFRAAKAAGLKEVPVLVRENVNGDAVALALVANLLREDLTSVEQAQGFKRLQDEQGWNQKKLAEELNISPSTVSQRLAILNLPEETQGLIGREQVTLDWVSVLAKVAKTSPELADHFAGVIAENGELRWPHILDGYEGVAFALSGRLGPTKANELFDDEDFVNACKSVFGKQEWDWPSWGDDDAAAGREFGCLVELRIPSVHGVDVSIQILTDPEFIRARVEHKLEQAKKDAKKLKNVKQEGGKAAPEKTRSQQDAERVEAEREKRERNEALAFNEEIGSKLAREFFAPEITLDRMKLIALMITEGSEHRGLAQASYAFLDPAKVSVNDRGTVKVQGMMEAHHEMSPRVEKCKTPEEVLGVLLFAIVGSKLVDARCVAQSSRPFYTLPGDYNKKPLDQMALREALIAIPAGDTHDVIQAQLDELTGVAGDDD